MGDQELERVRAAIDARVGGLFKGQTRINFVAELTDAAIAAMTPTPIVIEGAILWKGPDPDADVELFLGKWFESWLPGHQKLLIRTPDGEITASPGDWIIKDATGEFSVHSHILAAIATLDAALRGAE